MAQGPGLPRSPLPRSQSLCPPAAPLPALITCPAMGFLQAPQTPLATVATPSLLRSDCRLPSMLSSWLPGFGGSPGGELLPVFPWAMNCGERGSQGWGLPPPERGPMEATSAASSRGLGALRAGVTAQASRCQRGSWPRPGLTRETRDTRHAGHGAQPGH